jgi:hypothetical protein
MNIAKAVCFGILIFSLYGCGGEQLSEQETAPYKKAVSVYLKDNNMEMKVVGFKSLKVSDDKAIGVLTLQDVEGLYAIKPKWQFTFIKEDGKWIAQEHKVL